MLVISYEVDYIRDGATEHRIWKPEKSLPYISARNEVDILCSKRRQLDKVTKAKLVHNVACRINNPPTQVPWHFLSVFVLHNEINSS